MKRFNTICKCILWFCVGFMAIIWGFLQGTNEYTNVENKNYTFRWFGEFLRTDDTYLISRFMMLIIIGTIICVIAGILIKITNYTLKLENDNVKYYNENEKLKNDLSTKNEMNSGSNSKDIIINTMENFCKSNPSIIGIQLYECKETKNGKKIIYEILPTGLRYVANENEVVNSIHEKYYIHQDLIKKYTTIKSQYLNGNHTPYSQYLNNLIEKLCKNQNNPNITETTINEYCIMILLLQLVVGDKQFAINNLSIEFQNRINNKKRTGFLRALIEQDYYKFRHDGNNRKSDRIYLTNCIDIKNIPHMLIITFNPSVVGQSDYENYIDNIGKKFYNVLDKELCIVYNNYKVI